MLKLDREYVGTVGATAFEIWERRDHAVHAVGRVRGQRGGTRIEAEFRLSRRTRALLVLLFAVYAIAVVGTLQLPEQRSESLPPAAIAFAGAVVLGAGFTISARRQRSHLRTFISGLFPAVPAGDPP